MKVYKENELEKLLFSEIEKIAEVLIDNSFLKYIKEFEDYGLKIGKNSIKEKIVNIFKIK